MKKIIELFNDIDDSFIEEANEYVPTKKRKPVFFIVPAMACSIALLVYFNLPKQSLVSGIGIFSKNPFYRMTPLIDMNFEFIGGAGFMGLEIKDYNNLVSNNPVNNQNIETLNEICPKLPVYEMPFREKGQLKVQEEKMNEIASYYINLLNMKDYKVEKMNFDDLRPTYWTDYLSPTIVYSNNEYKISVNNNYEIEIQKFIPDEYHDTGDMNYEETYQYASDLIQKYGDFINKSIEIDIQGGDYNSDGSQNYFYEYYPKSTDLYENIINYNFKYFNIYIMSHFTGSAVTYRFNHKDEANIVNYFPIISYEEAKQDLLNGFYVERFNDPVVNLDKIVKSELVYRYNGKTNNPYYKIYVEVENERNNGNKLVQWYHIPAIQKEYIKNIDDFE